MTKLFSQSCIKNLILLFINTFKSIKYGLQPYNHTVTTHTPPVHQHYNQLFIGHVIAHKEGFGFMQRDATEPEGDDIFLPAHTLRYVLHGDWVRVRVTHINTRGRLEGEVIEILKYNTHHLVGRLLKEHGQWIVSPEDQRIHYDIFIDPSHIKNAIHGQVVVVTITHYPNDTRRAQGIITEILGNMNDPGIEIEIAVRKFNIPYIFSEKALHYAEHLPDTIQAIDWDNRIDLRDIHLITIDGEDARDFDDAVYCEPIGNQSNHDWRLLVAIADVSYYVSSGNPLDIDAQERTTSVYFPRKVIPMLPEKISNGLCSLMPHVDRLCMVADMVVSNEGIIKAYQFYPAIMHSRARLTYNQVWQVLSQKNNKDTTINNNPAYTVFNEIHHLYSVFQAFLNARKQRGAIEFETTETQFIFNSIGGIETIQARVRNDAHRLIEECMLAANVCAANMLTTYNQTALYRIHEGPTPNKLDTLRKFLNHLGLQLSGGNNPTANDYAQLMQIINTRKDAQALQSIILRSMQQAVYTPDNVGHFGLSYKAYTHFTSPIRRYPDLLVHRTIKAILSNEVYAPIQTAKDPNILNTKKKTVSPHTHLSNPSNKFNQSIAYKPLQNSNVVSSLNTANTSEPLNHKAWKKLGILCSTYERRADEASRDVISWLKCQYMQTYIGEPFKGIITGVANFGLFVTINDLYVEGSVHVTELGADYFQYIETTHELYGSKTGIRYTIGQTVYVQVICIDLESRRIELKLIKQTDTHSKKNRKNTHHLLLDSNPCTVSNPIFNNQPMNTAACLEQAPLKVAKKNFVSTKTKKSKTKRSSTKLNKK